MQKNNILNIKKLKMKKKKNFENENFLKMNFFLKVKYLKCNEIETEQKILTKIYKINIY